MPDREKVISCLEGLAEGDWRECYSDSEVQETAIQTLNLIDELLKEQEAASAHWDDDTGHWIEGDRNGIDQHTRTTGEMIDTFRCSWCGFYQYWKTPFCPNCGAKMEGSVKLE